MKGVKLGDMFGRNGGLDSFLFHRFLYCFTDVQRFTSRTFTLVQCIKAEYWRKRSLKRKIYFKSERVREDELELIVKVVNLK